MCKKLVITISLLISLGILVQPALAEKKKFSGTDVKNAINSYIEKKVEAEGNIFRIYDPKSQYTGLALNFVKIHDPVREIGDGQYFACSDFSVKGKNDKLYDIDFWLNELDGRLIVTQTQIHKEPALKGNKWVKAERYTFINDSPSVVQ